MENNFSFQLYDFTLSANGVQTLPAMGAYFRVMSATGALSVTVNGKGTASNLQAGQGFQRLPFDRLTLKDLSGAPNSGVILAASSEFFDNRMNGTFDLSAASLAALESIDLNAATQDMLRRPLQQTGGFKSNAVLAANTPETVFTAGANANGAIILSAGIAMNNVVGFSTFLAKATAPASVVDGDHILTGSLQGAAGAAGSCNMPSPQFIAAGVGLYFISDVAYGAAANGLRACRYRLL